MKIIVYPHTMELGGSQLNAVQLAGAVSDLGHDVIVVSEPGPLVALVDRLGLEHVAIPARRRRPSAPVAGLLRDLVARRGVDVVHGHEWPPAFDAFLALQIPTPRCPVVASVMSMSVVPFLPRSIPLLVGTADIHDAAVAAGHRRVGILEPPVDTDADHPAVDGTAFRDAHGLPSDVPVVVTVCRLVPQLKRESLLATCDAVEMLYRKGIEVRFLVAGDGPVRTELAQRAEHIAARTGKDLIILAGELTDPRPAYAAADVVVGMGGSAIRGMAFGKPLVVVGEDGFSELLTPSTSERFLRSGWYGTGPGSRGSGSMAIAEALETVVGCPSERSRLGTFGRDLAVSRFSLRAAGVRLEREYRNAIEGPAPSWDLVQDAARSLSRLAAYKVDRKVQRIRGTVAVDDANSAPVAVRPPR